MNTNHPAANSVRTIVCCSVELELPDFTNTCTHCGSDYNWAAQRLAPREQWEEKLPSTRQEYWAIEFRDSGYSLGEDDYFDEANEFDEDEDEE